jgi:hypothetical protein
MPEAIQSDSPVKSGVVGWQNKLFFDARSFKIDPPSKISRIQMARTSLLTAIDSTSHVHLIVGSNSLAAARCTKSLEVGAKPLLIVPETAELHYALQKRIDSGEVRRLAKSFEDKDVFQLGREDINRVVDAVFVTSGPRDPISKLYPWIFYIFTNENRRTHLPTVQKKPDPC